MGAFVEIPPCPCPYCGIVLNAAATEDADVATPTPGNITMCATCAGVSRFNDQLKMVKVAPAELRGYLDDPAFRKLYEQARIFQIIMTARRGEG